MLETVAARMTAVPLVAWQAAGANRPVNLCDRAGAAADHWSPYARANLAGVAVLAAPSLPGAAIARALKTFWQRGSAI